MTTCKKHQDSPAKGYSACPGCEVERLREERDAYRDSAHGMSADLTTIGERCDQLQEALEKIESMDSLQGHVMKRIARAALAKGEQP